MQPAHYHISLPHVVMRRHAQMRQEKLVGCRRAVSLQHGKLAHNAVRTQVLQEVELPSARSLRTMIGEIDDLSLICPLDSGMRLINKACQSLREPMVATRELAVAVHPLLNNDPIRRRR